MTLSEDFAGLGGDRSIKKTSANATKYWGFGGGWIFSVHGEGGYIHPLQSATIAGEDAVRLTDRFFGPEMRGFDIRGIGPRVVRVPYNADGTLAALDIKNDVNDALGGRAYYMGRLELELPVSSGMKSMGLRPSAFIDAGSLWGLKTPVLTDVVATCFAPLDSSGHPTGPNVTINPGAANLSCPTNYTRADGFKEFFLGNSPRPRLSIGIGVNWVSPFGPLRLDLAKAILKQKGDAPKLFSFNVGTQF
jgi:outer membrane protein insertion porin family